MSSINAISVEKLVRLVGVPRSPALLDVRTDEDFRADPRLIPGSIRRSHQNVADWASAYAGQSVVVLCREGHGVSEGVAAWLREAGAASAEILTGGYAAWAAADLPLVPQDKLPPRDAEGRTVWVTRARPKVDRIACPWLIRRFVDPHAVFLFVAPQEVRAVAERFGAVNLGLGLARHSPISPARLIAAATIVGLFGIAVSLLLFVLALRHLGSAQTRAYFPLAPFIAAIVALLLLDEAPTTQLSIAGLLMGIRLRLLLAERCDNVHAREATEHEHAHVRDEHHRPPATVLRQSRIFTGIVTNRRGTSKCIIPICNTVIDKEDERS